MVSFFRQMPYSIANARRVVRGKFPWLVYNTLAEFSSADEHTERLIMQFFMCPWIYLFQFNAGNFAKVSASSTTTIFGYKTVLKFSAEAMEWNERSWGRSILYFLLGWKKKGTKLPHSSAFLLATLSVTASKWHRNNTSLACLFVKSQLDKS